MAARTTLGLVSLAALMAAAIAGAGPARGQGEGDYRGVEPGEAGDPAARQSRCRRRGGRTPLTWIGFQVREGGGARVFVQLCGEVPFEQEVVDGKLLVALPGAAFTSHNARRPLDTRYFETPVARVVSRRLRARKRDRRRGVELVITFKDPAEAQHASAMMKTEQDGFTYLYLDFTPGS